MHINKELRINERIRAKECRLIDEEGKQLGIFSIRDALARAREKGLDLIEVSPTANPPVCKIMDYGKYKYNMEKRDREARKKHHVAEMKGIKLRPCTDEHDLQFKLRHIIRFIQNGDKVKITVVFRSREISHPDIAQQTLNRVAEATADIAVVEKAAGFEGRTMTMILGPKT